MQCGAAETSCNTYNGRTYACNSGLWDQCTGATPNCENGVCVATGISFTISADPTAIDTTSTSAIDFLVEDAGGNPVSGVTVTITAVTEAAGAIMVGTSCTTNLAGICPGGLTYGPGLSVGLKTITAKADDGVSPVVSSSVDVIVGDVAFECSIIDNDKWLNPGPPIDIGSCSDLNTHSCGSDKEYENCGPCHQNNCPDGTFSSCFSEYQVCGCDCVATGPGPGPGPCVPAMTCDPSVSWSACGSINPAEQERSCDDGCGGTVNEVRSCCLTDADCANPKPVCDTSIEQCVECLVSDDCLGTEVCDTTTGISTNNFCTPCGAEGEDPGDALLCCFGLGYWDMDGDGTEECTSACDPKAWFFCNPLRGTVGTITQAGETMLGYILGLIGSVALLFIIIAGMMYMTSAGNEERISSSKRILTGAVIGLMIALLAYGLLQVIMTVLEM